MNDLIIHYLIQDDLEPTGIVTDTFYYEKKMDCCEQVIRVQSADLNIELDIESLNYSNGIISLDVDSIAVTEELKVFLLGEGVEKSNFRQLTVNSETGILHQLIALPCYKIWGGAINDKHKLCKKCGRTVKFFEPDEFYLLPERSMHFGCIVGRVDFQDIFLSDHILQKINNFSSEELPVVSLPIYDNSMSIIMENRTSEFELVDMERFNNELYLNILRFEELIATLQYAKEINNQALGLKIFNKIKKLDNLPFENKKTAMMLYKSIKG